LGLLAENLEILERLKFYCGPNAMQAWDYLRIVFIIFAMLFYT